MSKFSPQTVEAQVDLAGRSVFAEKTYAVPAGAGNYTVKGAPGRVVNAVVTAAGTATDNAIIYDNSQGAASGTILAEILGGTAVGTQITIQMPAGQGITVVNVASGPGFTLGYS